jgi:CxxC motif-containing protein
LSCEIGLEVNPDNTLTISGQGCPRGAEYAEEEYTNPVRILTSTVKILGAPLERIPVRTESPVPKSLIMHAMKIINEVEITAPVKMGHIVISNLLNTGINVIASRSLLPET